MAQFELAHCELYHPYIHGTVYNAEPEDSTVHDEDYVYPCWIKHAKVTIRGKALSFMENSKKSLGK